MALFFLATCAAFFYTSVKLHIVDASDAVWVFGMMAVAGIPLSFFIPYKMTLERIAAKAVNDST